MSDPPDDLEAVRAVQEALKPFEPDVRIRIIRWALERLGQANPVVSGGDASTSLEGGPLPPGTTLVVQPTTDIKSFTATKNPKTDQQFAAVVAYYYTLEAPKSERKSGITADDLIEACRKVGRKRPGNAPQTLRNAHQSGLLDKGDGSGEYILNAVGENLVAMVLSESGAGPSEPIKRGRKKKRAAKPKEETPAKKKKRGSKA